MKFLKGLLYFILIIYTLACVVLYFMQEQFIFQADKLSDSHVYRKGKEIKVEVDEETFLSCYYNQVANSKGVILYLHGNKGSNRRCIRQSDMVQVEGYDVLMPDYRGYGKSDGAPINDKQMYGDMQKVYDRLKEMYDEEDIIITAYSLGTGMATYLAANNKPKEVFLIAPYVSIIDMKNRIMPLIPNFLLKFKFRNDKHLKAIECPVTLFHGEEDRVIPFDSSIQLEKIKAGVDMISLGKESHRGSIFSRTVRNTMRKKLQ